MCSYFPKGLWLFLLPWILREPTPVSGLKERHHPHMLLIHEKSHAHICKQMRLGCWMHNKHPFFLISAIDFCSNGSSGPTPPVWRRTDDTLRQQAACVTVLLWQRHIFLPQAPYPDNMSSKMFSFHSWQKTSSLTSQTQIRVKNSFRVHWHFARVRRLKSKNHCLCICCWLVLNHGVC